MNSKPTCGVLYSRVRELAMADSSGFELDAMRLFTYGFVAGQAEKVYLGACKAAMFRVGERWREMFFYVMERILLVYDLSMVFDGNEIWICRHQHAGLVNQMLAMQTDSPLWHKARADLCGVPDDEVDVLFHLRQGAGQVCD